MIDFKHFKTEFKAEDNVGKIAGYANIYGVKDLGNDIVEHGAFADSIKGKKKLPMLWNHDADGVPIGKWTEIKEDSKGLHVSGSLTMSLQKARDVFDSIKDGVLDGLSIGFKTIEREVKGDVRHILKGDLWEVSVVNFPMNPGSQIDMVKACGLTERELERALVMPDAGLSRSVARALMRGGFKALNATQDAGESAESRMLKTILNEIRARKGVSS